MFAKVWFRIGAFLLLIAGALGLGAAAYNLGLARGAVMAQTLPAADGTVRLAGPAHFMGAWHFGFAPFGFFITLILAFLFFGFLGRLFFHGMMRGPAHWGGRRAWGGPMGGPSHWEGGVPAHIAEMHRKLHEEEAKTAPEHKTEA